MNRRGGSVPWARVVSGLSGHRWSSQECYSTRPKSNPIAPLTQRYTVYTADDRPLLSPLTKLQSSNLNKSGPTNNGAFL